MWSQNMTARVSGRRSHPPKLCRPTSVETRHDYTLQEMNQWVSYRADQNSQINILLQPRSIPNSPTDVPHWSCSESQIPPRNILAHISRRSYRNHVVQPQPKRGVITLSRKGNEWLWYMADGHPQFNTLFQPRLTRNLPTDAPRWWCSWSPLASGNTAARPSARGTMPSNLSQYLAWP